MAQHRYGWRPSPNDRRDFTFSVRPSAVLATPPSIDQRPLHPPVYDQGDLGSCTAQAGADLHQYLQRKIGQPGWWTPSTLFLYYNNRLLDGTIPWDSGSYLRTTLKSIAKYGICQESTWPYDIDRFTEQPPDDAYTEAEQSQGLVYCRVEQTLCQLQGVLASGYPIAFGFTVYESFEDIGSDGVMKMPEPGERVLGGHAVVKTGYANLADLVPRCPARHFICRNSWDDVWGDQGYFYMPYEFALSPDCDDHWVLQTIEDI